MSDDISVGRSFYALGVEAPLPLHIAAGYETSETGCWLWKRSKSRDGYGWTSYRNKTYQAHRFVYQWVKGAVPVGMQLDHLCRVRHCVNPDHLDPVTPLENLQRGNTPAGATSCSNGHALSDWHGQRRCLTCYAEYEAARRPIKAAQARVSRQRMAEQSCSTAGCCRPMFALQLCQPHYRAQKVSS